VGRQIAGVTSSLTSDARSGDTEVVYRRFAPDFPAFVPRVSRAGSTRLESMAGRPPHTWEGSMERFRIPILAAALVVVGIGVM
jgi:hypothetical protein